MCSHTQLFCLSAVDELQVLMTAQQAPLLSQFHTPSYNLSRCTPRLLMFSIGGNRNNYTLWHTFRKPLSCFSLPSFMLFAFYLLSVFDYGVHVYIEKCIHVSLGVQHGAKSVLSVYEVLCSVHSTRKRFISLSLYNAIICSLSPLPPFHSISKLLY